MDDLNTSEIENRTDELIPVIPVTRIQLSRSVCSLEVLVFSGKTDKLTGIHIFGAFSLSKFKKSDKY